MLNHSVLYSTVSSHVTSSAHDYEGDLKNDVRKIDVKKLLRAEITEAVTKAGIPSHISPGLRHSKREESAMQLKGYDELS